MYVYENVKVELLTVLFYCTSI